MTSGLGTGTLMRGGLLRLVGMAVIVTTAVVTEIGQGPAQSDPALVVRIGLSEYGFKPSPMA
jgi:hypothetical protein